VEGGGEGRMTPERRGEMKTATRELDYTEQTSWLLFLAALDAERGGASVVSLK